MDKKEIFLKKARDIYGDKYDYSKVEYINSDASVCIICPEHGEFWQTPYMHLHSKIGCPKCGQKYVGLKNKDTKDSFIEKSKKVHSGKYDYSKVEYIDSKTKVCIICPEHGEFWQAPNSHISGRGCTECAKISRSNKNRFSREDFIKKAHATYGNRYDYTEVEYKNARNKVCIICPEHGEFWQYPYAHLNGVGCPKCSYINRGIEHRMEINDFITRGNKIHNNKYDYSKVTEIINCKENVIISCPKHGDFKQTPDAHLHGSGCPICGKSESLNEKELYEYCHNIVGDEVLQRNRTIIPPHEIDIYIPSLSIGIEYNGLKWHSDEYKKDRNIHLLKLNKCKEKNVKLIQVFEDEYVYHKDIVLNKIQHLIGIENNKSKISARECVINEITYDISEKFLDKYHIQGSASATIYIGCFFSDTLIGVMTFKKIKDGQWELNRFASDYKYICRGVGGKLFSYFIKNYNPMEVKSFADRRWTINERNNLYTQLGFKFSCYTKPDYRYFKPNDGQIRYHKFNFRKQALHKKYGMPLTMTEKEMTESLGYYRIYDCGLIKYIWKKEK